MSDSSYVSSLSAYKPPTFIPDTPLANSGAPKITLLPQDAGNEDVTALQQPAFASTLTGYMKKLGGDDVIPDAGDNHRSTSIGEGIKSYFNGVNNQLVDSDRQTRDLLTGKTNDTGAVASAVEEADLSLDMTLAIAKRVTSAYQTIQNITF